MIITRKERLAFRYKNPSEAEIEQGQYDSGPNPHHDQNPLSLITGSLVTKAGGYSRIIVDNDPLLSNLDAAQTAISFVDDGLGGTAAYPVQTAGEKYDLPVESAAFLPYQAALTVLGNESLELEAMYNTVWQSDHTHPTTPHSDLYTSQEAREDFARSQIGLEPLPHPKHRRPLAEAETIGADGIGFW